MEHRVHSSITRVTKQSECKLRDVVESWQNVIKWTLFLQSERCVCVTSC